MSYWVFKCKRTQYKLDERLDDGENQLTWLVTKHETQIKRGDVVFLAQTTLLKKTCVSLNIPSSPKPGIRAVFKLQSEPIWMKIPEADAQYWYEPPTDEAFRVKGVLTQRLNFISYDVLKSTSGLADLSIFSGKGRFNQGTNFPIKDCEGPILMDLAKKYVLPKL